MYNVFMYISTKSRKLIIFPGWQSCLLIITFPLFVLMLDTISAMWMRSEIFSGGIINVVIVFYLILFVMGAQVLVISNESISFWSYLIWKKSILIKDIAVIKAKVDVHYSVNTFLTPIATFYFINDKSKNLYKLPFGIFSKKDIYEFLNKVILAKQDIILDDNTKLLMKENDDNVKSEINKVYLFIISGVFIILPIVILVFCIIYLLKR